MESPLRTSLLVSALAIAAVSACGHPSPRGVEPTVSLVPASNYCWWAVLRTVRRPDSVAFRYTQAFQSLGFNNASWQMRGDTSWAHAGPQALPGQGSRAIYESRAVAYWHGDSTHFRLHVTIAKPVNGWSPGDDSTAILQGNIDFCADIERRAQIGVSAPKSPTGEEALPVWSSSR